MIQICEKRNELKDREAAYYSGHIRDVMGGTPITRRLHKKIQILFAKPGDNRPLGRPRRR